MCVCECYVYICIYILGVCEYLFTFIVLTCSCLYFDTFIFEYCMRAINIFTFVYVSVLVNVKVCGCVGLCL